MPQTLIMVLSADVPKFQLMTDAMRKTWASHRTDKFDTKFYYGTTQNMKAPSGQVVLRGNNIICGVREGYPTILTKTLMAFDYALKKWEFEYIFRCCASSFIVPKNLIKFIKDKPKKRLYCGKTGKHGPYKFITGSGYFISRDMVRMLVNNKNRMMSYKTSRGERMPGSYDDVMVGRCMTDMGIPFVDGIKANTNGKPTKEMITKDNYHYHFPPNPNHMHTMMKLLKQEGIQIF